MTQPNADKPVTVTIDGLRVEVPDDATILTAIRKLNKDVPTLCYSDRMKPYGACRTCLVEHIGRKPVAACHTPVWDERLVPPGRVRRRYNPRRNRERWARRWARRR